MSRLHALAAAVTAVALFAGFHPEPHAQPDPSLSDVSVARLKAMVLPCELPSPAGAELSFTTALCAFAADELRRRAFDGASERLLAWWRAERARLEQRKTSERPISRTTPEQLKTSFLQCERLAQETPLDFGTATHCSMVYEELKQRVFAGDFDRLVAWWQQQAKTIIAEGAARGMPR